MLKIIFCIILFVVSFVLLFIEQLIGQKKPKIGEKPPNKKAHALLSLVTSIVISIVGSISYDFMSKMWYEETIRTGVLRGSTPYFVVTNAEYGNLCIELVQEENRSCEGFEIAIGYVNSDMYKVIEWSYSEPIWINVEPMEYQISIINEDKTYSKTDVYTIEKDTATHVIIPIYDDRLY